MALLTARAAGRLRHPLAAPGCAAMNGPVSRNGLFAPQVNWPELLQLALHISHLPQRLPVCTENDDHGMMLISYAAPKCDTEISA